MSTGDKICKHGIWLALCAVCTGLKPETPNLILNDMDKFKTEKDNFEKFETFIRNLSVEHAKDFIIEFFGKYKYLLNEEIGRVMDDDLLKVIKEKEKRYIAVIANNIRDFRWWIETTHPTAKMQSQRHYIDGGNVHYIGITSPEQVRGYSFNEIVETPDGQKNKEYADIMNSIIPCLFAKKCKENETRL